MSGTSSAPCSCPEGGAAEGVKLKHGPLDTTDTNQIVDLDATVYALDATTIDLCLLLFEWAPFRKTKAAVKMHTLLDLRGAIPAFIHISDGKMHEVNVLDFLPIEAGAFYVMDPATWTSPGFMLCIRQAPSSSRAPRPT